MSSNRSKLAEENQILFVKNLPFAASTNDLYTLFGQFGTIRQIRLGNTQSTRGTAYVVYDSPTDARTAFNKLSGFNYQNRYLVVLYHSFSKMQKAQLDLDSRRAALEELKKENGLE